MPRTIPRLSPFSDFAIDYTPVMVHRRRARMTQSELARAVGVHLATVQRIESNQTDPRNRLVLSIAKALGVPIHDLYWVTSPDET